MDELGIDIQVIYPTIFIFPTARRAEVDLAICRSYNRWMADIVAKAPDRFRWVVVPPLLNMDSRRRRAQVRQRARRVRRVLARLGSGSALERSLFLSDCMSGERARPADLRALGQRQHRRLMIFSLDEPGFCKFKLAVVGAFHSLVNRRHSRALSRSCASASSKSARSGFPTRFTIWRGAICRRGKTSER